MGFKKGNVADLTIEDGKIVLRHKTRYLAANRILR
jgi:hypothetical protein